MKLGVEIEAPFTSHRRHGVLIYDETGENLEGFIDYGQAGPREADRFYPRETVRIICSLQVQVQEYKTAMRDNRILRPGDKLS